MSVFHSVILPFTSMSLVIGTYSQTRNHLPSGPTGSIACGTLAGILVSSFSKTTKSPIFPETLKDVSLVATPTTTRLYMKGIFGHAAAITVFEGFRTMIRSTPIPSIDDPIQTVPPSTNMNQDQSSTSLELDTQIPTTSHQHTLNSSQNFPPSPQRFHEPSSIENFLAGGISGLVFKAAVSKIDVMPFSPSRKDSFVLLSTCFLLYGLAGVAIGLYEDSKQIQLKGFL